MTGKAAPGLGDVEEVRGYIEKRSTGGFPVTGGGGTATATAGFAGVAGAAATGGGRMMFLTGGMVVCVMGDSPITLDAVDTPADGAASAGMVCMDGKD